MAPRVQLAQRHSDNMLIAHVVWATARRAPLLTATADSWLSEILRRKAREAGGVLIACGNAADHVHVLARYPSTATVAQLVQRLKGASAREWNLCRRSPGLAWQAGYWATSVSPSLLPMAIRYVERQRVHHGESSAPEAWEAAAAGH